MAAGVVAVDDVAGGGHSCQGPADHDQFVAVGGPDVRALDLLTAAPPRPSPVEFSPQRLPADAGQVGLGVRLPLATQQPVEGGQIGPLAVAQVDLGAGATADQRISM
ncbi:hypothetical protein [Streptomyces shenzhenensis]|uniref:hypothetical protein n=1 Tax=Streptomyces shenzhenensis TaxID=943815 RepID=UPI0036D13771